MANAPKEIAPVERIFSGLDISQDTKREYIQRSGNFFGFVQANGFGYATFAEYKRMLARQEISVAAKNKYLTVARMLLKEMRHRKMLPEDITENIKSFGQSKRHRREGLDEQEVRAMAARLHRMPNTLKNERRRAFFCLLALQGLRQAEIRRLDIGHIDLKRHIAFVRGKGDDDREPVHLAPETVKTLRQYVRKSAVRDGALFRSIGNRGSERITTKTIRREMESVLLECGIKKTVHGFRHFYITTLLKRFSVREVRKLSRHKNLEMLLVYDDETHVAAIARKAFSSFKSVKL